MPGVSPPSCSRVAPERLGASAAAGGFDRSGAQLTRTTLRLDAKGRKQAAKAAERLLADLERIEANAAKRLGNDPHASGASDAAVLMMLFDAVRSSGDGAAPKPHRAGKRSA